MKRVKLCGYCGKPVLRADAQMEWTATFVPQKPKVAWYIDCLNADQEIWPSGNALSKAPAMLAIVEKRGGDRVRYRL